MPETFLHHNRGVPKLRFTVRVDRSIRHVRTKAFNAVLVNQDNRETFLVTKGLCATASRLGRLKLVPYTGRWPRLVLLWTRLKEVLNDCRK